MNCTKGHNAVLNHKRLPEYACNFRISSKKGLAFPTGHTVRIVVVKRNTKHRKFACARSEYYTTVSSVYYRGLAFWCE